MEAEEPFPDLNQLDDAALKALIERKRQEEEQLSLTRRVIHGQIDLLRGELQARLATKHGEGGTGHLSLDDVDKLSEILAHRGPPVELSSELAELE